MITSLSTELSQFLHEGTIIPAHPLALNQDRSFDEYSQRRLTRYYMECGAGGIAIAVHSTQFEIRDPKVNLFDTVLRCAAEEVASASLSRPFLKIAGLCGPEKQAIKEAHTAVQYGYDIGLLSMAGLQSLTEEQILDRTRKVAECIPVFGFYLQPSVGGRVFSYDFWRVFAEIENVVAIKVAAFNRYQTLDVVRAVCNSSRSDEIALYTGNDDNILIDLLTPYKFEVEGKTVEKEFVGGLLGHWGVWTRSAVQLFDKIKDWRNNVEVEWRQLLNLQVAITDMNAAIFDPAHQFHGCIPGIHEVLRRQGLLQGRWCLNPEEELSAGQAAEIDRVCSKYPHLTDDDFVSNFLVRDGVRFMNTQAMT